MVALHHVEENSCRLFYRDGLFHGCKMRHHAELVNHHEMPVRLVVIGRRILLMVEEFVLGHRVGLVNKLVLQCLRYQYLCMCLYAE